ncbi:hypothetical protein PAPYR_9879 [Paratrimastix pyriformis]|uniref:Uncharacterized protein n=1 Tax=Paratrimastix pyriformis TaxID=342808 RepID=A0ABQ8UB17_9EUKA|nr:hypothetical protein PAPYR_9879 [Paratrimastix pyriformis]
MIKSIWENNRRIRQSPVDISSAENTLFDLDMPFAAERVYTPLAATPLFFFFTMSKIQDLTKAVFRAFLPKLLDETSYLNGYIDPLTREDSGAAGKITIGARQKSAWNSSIARDWSMGDYIFDFGLSAISFFDLNFARGTPYCDVTGLRPGLCTFFPVAGAPLGPGAPDVAVLGVEGSDQCERVGAYLLGFDNIGLQVDLGISAVLANLRVTDDFAIPETLDLDFINVGTSPPEQLCPREVWQLVVPEASAAPSRPASDPAPSDAVATVTSTSHHVDKQAIHTQVTPGDWHKWLSGNYGRVRVCEVYKAGKADCSVATASPGGKGLVHHLRKINASVLSLYSPILYSEGTLNSIRWEDLRQVYELATEDVEPFLPAPKKDPQSSPKGQQEAAPSSVDLEETKGHPEKNPSEDGSKAICLPSPALPHVSPQTCLTQSVILPACLLRLASAPSRSSKRPKKTPPADRIAHLVGHPGFYRNHLLFHLVRVVTYKPPEGNLPRRLAPASSPAPRPAAPDADTASSPAPRPAAPDADTASSPAPRPAAPDADTASSPAPRPAAPDADTASSPAPRPALASGPHPDADPASSPPAPPPPQGASAPPPGSSAAGDTLSPYSAPTPLGGAPKSRRSTAPPSSSAEAATVAKAIAAVEKILGTCTEEKLRKLNPAGARFPQPDILPNAAHFAGLFEEVILYMPLSAEALAPPPETMTPGTQPSDGTQAQALETQPSAGTPRNIDERWRDTVAGLITKYKMRGLMALQYYGKFRLAIPHISDMAIKLAERTPAATATKSRFDTLERDVAVTRQEVAVTRQEVAVTRQEVAGIKSRFDALERDVAEIKHEMAGIKLEIRESFLSMGKELLAQLKQQAPQ